MGVAALVLGIVSIILGAAFSWTVWVGIVGIVCGAAGIVLGAIGRKTHPSDSLALAGLVLSIVGLAISAICVISCAACYCSTYGALWNYYL